jgi:hypothetical protein
MGKRFLRIGALFQMAGKANLGLSLRPEHSLMGRMDCVAIGAVQIFRIMHAARPVQAYLLFMTGHALLIVLGSAGGAVGSPERHARTIAGFLPALQSLDMLTARAVARLALGIAVAEGGAAISSLCVFGGENCFGHVVGMTAQTGVRALDAVAVVVSRLISDSGLGCTGNRYDKQGKHCTCGDGR